ncbi:hypothetical protein Hanom_Chr05g00439621 [Helianthus anomalus]
MIQCGSQSLCVRSWCSRACESFWCWSRSSLFWEYLFRSVRLRLRVFYFV